MTDVKQRQIEAIIEQGPPYARAVLPTDVYADFVGMLMDDRYLDLSDPIKARQYIYECAIEFDELLRGISSQAYRENQIMNDIAFGEVAQ